MSRRTISGVGRRYRQKQETSSVFIVGVVVGLVVLGGLVLFIKGRGGAQPRTPERASAPPVLKNPDNADMQRVLLDLERDLKHDPSRVAEAQILRRQVEEQDAAYAKESARLEIQAAEDIASRSIRAHEAQLSRRLTEMESDHLREAAKKQSRRLSQATAAVVRIGLLRGASHDVIKTVFNKLWATAQTGADLTQGDVDTAIIEEMTRRGLTPKDVRQE